MKKEDFLEASVSMSVEHVPGALKQVISRKSSSKYPIVVSDGNRVPF